MNAPRSMQNMSQELHDRLEQFRQEHPALAEKLNELQHEIISFTESHLQQQQRLAKIGTSLGAERDINTLLEMILLEAMRLNSADGGTFYSVKTDPKGNPIALEWVMVKNGTLKTWMGGTSGVPIPFPEIPLYRDGKENHANVSAHVALTGETINLQDVYVAEGFDFQGTRIFDTSTGYRSKSMLVFPLRNHENEIVAVMQLINVTDDSGNIFPFAEENEFATLSLASQAAVAITNARLIISLENLFDAFIRAIAQSIDAKDEVTGGHISRVAELTMMIARAVNETDDGSLARIHFSDDELRELSVAAWLHDTGKITTPETVMFKATKLEAYVDRIDNVKLRFELARSIRQIDTLQKKLAGVQPPPELREQWEQLDRELEESLKKNIEEWNLIEFQNIGGEFLKPETAEVIKTIANQTFTVPDDIALTRTVPYHGYLSRKTWEAKQEYKGPREVKAMPVESNLRRLMSDDELLNMMISRGTINQEELLKMRDHVVQTINILDKLPFPRKMQNVPEYAGGHHEFVNGKGYPKGLAGPNLPLQSRIMALADVFEALSAADRPYKKAKPMSEVLKILGFMVKGGDLDQEVYDVFISKGVMAEYVREKIDAKQIDIDLTTLNPIGA